MASTLYGFAYSTQSLRYLETIPKKFRKQIVAKVYTLASNPYPPLAKLVQGMSDGEERVYRIRSGDYRILYAVRGIIIVILDIGHRKNVYR